MPVSDELLREKAVYFHQKLCSKVDCPFVMSNGWLASFKLRRGIRKLKISGEKLSADVDAIKPFKDELIQQLIGREIPLECVYNADESALWWKMLPKQTLVHEAEKNAPGRKLCKERITFMSCSNVLGTHKLPLQVIGRAKNPRCFKKKRPSGVEYCCSANAWQTSVLFKNWFHNCFVPQVIILLMQNY